MTTVILSPMNPWLQGGDVHDRLLQYWENRQRQGARTGSIIRPFQTVSIAV